MLCRSATLVNDSSLLPSCIHFMLGARAVSRLVATNPISTSFHLKFPSPALPPPPPSPQICKAGVNQSCKHELPTDFAASSNTRELGSWSLTSLQRVMVGHCWSCSTTASQLFLAGYASVKGSLINGYWLRMAMHAYLCLNQQA